MNTHRIGPRFCDQCGSVLESEARFCEACGTKVPANPRPPEQALPSIPGDGFSPDSSPTLPMWMKIVFIASALFALLIITGVAGRWVWKNRIVTATIDTLAPPVFVSPNPMAGSIPPSPPLVAPAEETRIETTETTRESPPLAGNDTPANEPGENPLFTWLDSQPWFRSLGESMPAGVTLSVLQNGENAVAEAGWDMIDIREIHSPESGFDPDVSPLIGLFRVSTDRRSVQWLDAVTGEWGSVDAFLLSRKEVSALETKSPIDPAPPFQIYDGNFEGEAPDGSPDPPIAVNDPLNPGNLVGLLKSPGPLRLELTADDASAAGSSPLTGALRFYLPEIARSRDESGVRLRVSLIGDGGKMAHGEMKIQSSDTWQPGSVRFTNPPSPLYGVSIEVMGIEGAVFVDDLQFVR